LDWHTGIVLLLGIWTAFRDQASALGHLKLCLPNGFHQTVGAAKILGRLVGLVITEHEVTVKKLLPLLHLALKDGL